MFKKSNKGPFPNLNKVINFTVSGFNSLLSEFKFLKIASNPVSPTISKNSIPLIICIKSEFLNFPVLNFSILVYFLFLGLLPKFVFYF